MTTDEFSSRSQRSQISRKSVYSSPIQRKEALRSALTKAQDLENTDSHAFTILQNVFEEVDRIHSTVSFDEKVEHQDQIVIDSEVMDISSRIIRGCTEKITKDCDSFNSTDFAQKLLTWTNNLPDTTVNETNWTLLEREIGDFKTTAHATLLLDYVNLSTLPVVSPQPKEKRQKLNTSRIKDSQAATKKPEKVVELKKEETSVEMTVENIRKLINRTYRVNSQPIDYFRLILDPTSFGKTIENSLHVSFLARDGKIKLSMDNEGNLLVLPCSKEMINQAKTQENKRHLQNVIGLDFHQWKLLRDVYRLDGPMITF